MPSSGRASTSVSCATFSSSKPRVAPPYRARRPTGTRTTRRRRRTGSLVDHRRRRMRSLLGVRAGGARLQRQASTERRAPTAIRETGATARRLSPKGRPTSRPDCTPSLLRLCIAVVHGDAAQPRRLASTSARRASPTRPSVRQLCPLPCEWRISQHVDHPHPPHLVVAARRLLWRKRLCLSLARCPRVAARRRSSGCAAAA